MINRKKMNKMKTKLTVLLAFFLVVFTAKAQDVDCATELSLFADSAKNKKYDEAAKYLVVLRKSCPDFHQAIYLYGEPTITYFVDNAKTEEEKVTLVKDLMLLLDEYDKFFPNNGKGNKVKKAMALFNNKVGTKDEVFQMLDNVFKTDRENFTDALAMYVYFEIFVDKYESGKDGIELQEVFDKYDAISDFLESEKNKLSEIKDELLQIQETRELSRKEETSFRRSEANLEAYETISISMDAKISLLSSCDRLVPFLEKSFDAKKTDEEWLSRSADRLYKKGCDNTPLFAKISEALHALNPTAKSAFKLAVVAYNKKDIQKAIKFFNESADLHTDKNEKAKVYYMMASNIYATSNKAQARSYAEKALAAKPSFGKAYLLIANLYANSVNDCGSTPFEKRSVNWLAAQMARKAGQVDSSLKGTAESAASSYEQRAPSVEDIFVEGMSGKTIQFNCWIGKSVKVPEVK
jgi:tetratricopeptide (TPR) repeat protein